MGNTQNGRHQLKFSISQFLRPGTTGCFNRPNKPQEKPCLPAWLPVEVQTSGTFQIPLVESMGTAKFPGPLGSSSTSLIQIRANDGPSPCQSPRTAIPR